MSTFTEQKYEDEHANAIRFSKDDYKQQQADTRKTTKRVTGTEFQETLVHDRTQPGSGSLSATAPTPANAALAPIVNTSSLQAQLSHLDHVDMPLEGEFGSIHMASAGEPSHIQLHPQPTEKSVPTQAELPSAIGESAAEGYEYIKSVAEPQIAKAKEMITNLTAKKESTSSSDAPPSTSAIDKAKSTLADVRSQASHLYEESVLPQLEKAKIVYAEKVQPQIEELKHKAAELTHRKSTAAPTSDRPAKATYHAPTAGESPPLSDSETFQQRALRYRNKAVSIWHGQEPMVKARMQQAARVIKTNKMEVPLMALGTLLVLWLSMSFIGWMAWPGQYSPAREQMVVFNPNQHAAVPTHIQHDTATAPTITPVNGPSQNVQGPSTLDTMKMKLTDAVDDLAMKTQDRLHHAIPSMPSMDDVKDAMPSMPAMQHMAAMPAMRAAAAANHLKATATDRATHLKDTIVDGVQNLKDRVMPATEHVVPAHEPGTPAHMHTEPTQQYQADDINAPPHQHNDGNIRA